MSAESAAQSIKKGYGLVADGDFETALDVGMRLKQMCHTSAFEIMALSLDGLGRTEEAVEILEEGVIKGPTVWLLWQLLGNYRSDLERYEQSHEAYEIAMGCPDANCSSIYLNIATVLGRQGRDSEALTAVESVTDPSMALRADGLRVSILIDQERFEEAMELGAAVLEGVTEQTDSFDLAVVEANVAKACWLGYGDREWALRLAGDALSHAQGLSSALWLIREVENRVSSGNRSYRLLILGDWPEPDDDGNPMGFFISYDVVAEGVEGAMEYVRRFEPAERRQSLRMDECEEVEPRPTDPAGVYKIGGYCLFKCEDDMD